MAMSSSDAYEIRLTKAAVKQLLALGAIDGQRVRSALRDILDDERVLLVHAIVDRRDLERWLRGR
jgi:hypothetical protein